MRVAHIFCGEGILVWSRPTDPCLLQLSAFCFDVTLLATNFALRLVTVAPVFTPKFIRFNFIEKYSDTLTSV